MKGGVFLEQDIAPYTTYSHFTHLFLIAHEAQRLGWQIYFRSTDSDECQQILQMYPVVQLGESASFNDPAFQPTMVFGVNNTLGITSARHQKPNAMGVYVISAHFWLEKETFRTDFVEWVRVGVAKDVDFILTQNRRMEDLAYYLLNFVARWQWRDRILSAPNNFCRKVAENEAQNFDRASVRRRMQVTDDEIVIINSGGPWSWTDADVFATAFAEVVREGARRIKFLQMGIMQESNTIQAEIIPFWENYLKTNQDLIQSRQLVVFTNWREASGCLPAWNYGADIGLNVSRDSAENYQAHRVRFIDYAKAGLPVLNSTGNFYPTYDAKDAVMLVAPGDLQGYKDLLWKIERGEIDLGAKRAAMQTFRESIMSEHLIPPILKHMLATGRVPAEERAPVAKEYHDLYQSVTQHQFANNFK
ncbi:MAG TPA: hypothetical protein PKW15_01735 [Alphaproteobacteria bacterium]|nr:hypothetical protein [Rhodospirillaceae bacterium]HRJ11945.1 hypothetical protein [Alphaproteobacteria bacterium]